MQELDANSKMIGCIEDSVDRMEDVLQQVQCELNGVQDKMEDIKIEVGRRKLVLNEFQLIRLLGLPQGWKICGGLSARLPILPVS